MIINKTYDKSLWLMLCSDKINRERIIEFINRIPLDLLNKMRISLGFYVDKEMNFSINKHDEFYKSFLNGEIKTNGDMRYWYMIEPRTGALSIGENVIDEDYEYDFFHMVIFPVDDKILRDDKGYNDCLIGEITNSYLDKVSDCISFHLIRFSLFDAVVTSYMGVPYKKNKYHLIDLDKMPDKYNLNNLKDRNSVKKLLRSKKNSRY